jgi:hypothetical protein
MVVSVDDGEAPACAGTGAYEISFYLLFNFSVKLKIDLKIQSIKKREKDYHGS